jgi:hypothetical protein
MKTKKQITVAEISKNKLEAISAHWEKFAKCYFWSPPGSASARRREEERNSMTASFKADGVVVSVSIQITCSCKNYYCERSVVVNGQRKAQGGRYLNKLIDQAVFVEAPLAAAG